MQKSENGVVEQHDKLKPMDEDGMLQVTSFSTEFYSFLEKDLLVGWPKVESAVEKHGLSIKLNLDDRSMTVSTTTRTRDPDIIDMARQFIELLSKAYVPVHVAIKILDGDLHHDYILVGHQEGGLALELGIKEDIFLKRWIHFSHILKDLNELLGVCLFLTGNTLTAAGKSLGHVKLIRHYVKQCIVNKVKPANLVKRLRDTDARNRVQMGLERLCLSEICSKELKNSGPLLNEDGMLQVTSFSSKFYSYREQKLLDGWPEVESAVEKHGLSIKLKLDDRSMTLSTTSRTRDPNIIDVARQFIELLSKTNVPVHVAIQILDGDVHHDYILAGRQEGGLALEHGIKEKTQFSGFRNLYYFVEDIFFKRWVHFSDIMEDLSELFGVNIYLTGNTLTVVGKSLEYVKVVRCIVKGCVVDKVEPADLVQRLRVRDARIQVQMQLERLSLFQM